MKHLLICTCLASPVAAQDQLTGEDFEALVEGNTYFYARPGEDPYGIEGYGVNRKVVWAFLNDTCEEGYWFEDDLGRICFVYPTSNNNECWIYTRTGEVVTATSQAGTDYELQQTTQSVPCLGPLVGV